MQDGPVILAGQFWGGAVVTQPATGYLGGASKVAAVIDVRIAEIIDWSESRHLCDPELSDFSRAIATLAVRSC